MDIAKIREMSDTELEAALRLGQGLVELGVGERAQLIDVHRPRPPS